MPPLENSTEELSMLNSACGTFELPHRLQLCSYAFLFAGIISTRLRKGTWAVATSTEECTCCGDVSSTKGMRTVLRISTVMSRLAAVATIVMSKSGRKIACRREEIRIMAVVSFAKNSTIRAPNSSMSTVYYRKLILRIIPTVPYVT